MAKSNHSTALPMDAPTMTRRTVEVSTVSTAISDGAVSDGTATA